MPYTVEVEWIPAYELLSSLRAYREFGAFGRTLELSAEWRSTIKKRGGKELSECLLAAGMVEGVEVLVRQSPEKEDVEATLEWLAGLTPGEIMNHFMPLLPKADQASLSRILAAITGAIARWDKVISLLRVWDRIYFRSVDPAILEGLRKDTDRKRGMAASLSPEDLIEEATYGVRVDPVEGEVRVLLVPQFHMRPWNTFEYAAGTSVAIHYPADVLAPEEGMPPQSLTRTIRALSDPRRLRILKAIAGGAQSFTDVAGPSALAKSTVHHHMMALRAAGLIRSHISYPFSLAANRYSFRPGAIERFAASLSAYLKEE